MSTIFNYSQLQVEAALKLLEQIEMNSLEGIRAYQFARYLSFHYLLQARGAEKVTASWSAVFFFFFFLLAGHVFESVDQISRWRLMKCSKERERKGERKGDIYLIWPRCAG